MSLPCAHFLTWSIDISCIDSPEANTPWRRMDCPCCWNCIVLSAQLHCIGLFSCCQSNPKIASYIGIGSTFMSYCNVCPLHHQVGWGTIWSVINVSPFANITCWGLVCVVGRPSFPQMLNW
jgi:hypothetical protein